MSKPLKSAVINFLFVVTTVVVWSPLLWLSSIALRPQEEFYQGALEIYPESFTTEILNEVLGQDSRYRAAQKNSVTVAAGTATIGTLLGVAVALFFVTQIGTLAVRRNLGYAFVTARFLPSAAIAPGIYWLLLNLRWIDTLQGLILAQVVFSLSLSVLLLTPVFARVPRSFLDQAEIEGASRLTTIKVVFWPQVRFAVLLTFLLNFTFTWNEYFLTSLLSETSSSQTLSVLVGSGVGQFRIRYNVLAAGGLVTLVPAVAVLVFLGFTRWVGRDT